MIGVVNFNIDVDRCSDVSIFFPFQIIDNYEGFVWI